MSSTASQWIDTLLRDSGVYRYAIVDAAEVEMSSQQAFDRWIAAGMHGGMSYMERNGELRSNPEGLLPGMRSMICCAFPYWHPDSRRSPGFAAYALGDDYHDVIRGRLGAVAAAIDERLGCQSRVCVDTAPLRERYWAQRAGLGFIGRNGHLIIPGAGSYFFLAELLTTAQLPEIKGDCNTTTCGDCGRCTKACPTGALQCDGSVDARRCLSYLTIEHRGEFSEGTDLHGYLYGCDICGRVCPHNANPVATDIEEFTPRAEVITLTPERAAAMTQQEFSAIFRRSAVKRTKLEGLRRNALKLLH